MDELSMPGYKLQRQRTIRCSRKQN